MQASLWPDLVSRPMPLTQRPHQRRTHRVWAPLEQWQIPEFHNASTQALVLQSTLCPAAALAAPSPQRRHQRISWRRPLSTINASGRHTTHQAAGPCSRTSTSQGASAHSPPTAAWHSPQAGRWSWIHAPAAVAAQRCPPAAAGSGSGHSAEPGQELSKQEIGRLLREAASVVSTAHLLVAADLGGFNAALIIWCAFRLACIASS